MSNDPEQVREFVRQQPFGAIVKPVVGTKHELLFTQKVPADGFLDDEAIRVCPAIYQEYVEGTRHIRINQFGSSSFACEIVTEDVDWRSRLSRDMRPFDFSQNLQEMCNGVLRRLGLRMGIMDLKLDETGEPVWLEINPQGQFLFIEGMIGAPVISHFTDFLAAELSLQ